MKLNSSVVYSAIVNKQGQTSKYVKLNEYTIKGSNFAFFILTSFLDSGQLP